MQKNHEIDILKKVDFFWIEAVNPLVMEKGVDMEFFKFTSEYIKLPKR